MAKKRASRATKKPSKKSHANLFMSTPAQRREWNRAAAAQGRSFSSWACVALDEAAKNQMADDNQRDL